MRRYAALTAVPVLLASAWAFWPRSARPAPPPAVKARCAPVVLAQETRTGHEADMPVTFCGGFRPGGWICAVTPWGPLAAGARLDCWRAPAPASARPGAGVPG